MNLAMLNIIFITFDLKTLEYLDLTDFPVLFKTTGNCLMTFSVSFIDLLFEVRMNCFLWKFVRLSRVI
jgi:hypothetical protein